MTAFLATLLAALEELTFGKKCCVLLAPHPKKKNVMASSLTKERVSFQKVVQTEVPEIVTGKTLFVGVNCYQLASKTFRLFQHKQMCSAPRTQ